MKNPFENPMKKSSETNAEEAPQEKAQFAIDEEGTETFSEEKAREAGPETGEHRGGIKTEESQWRKEHGGD